MENPIHRNQVIIGGGLLLGLLGLGVVAVNRTTTPPSGNSQQTVNQQAANSQAGPLQMQTFEVTATPTQIPIPTHVIPPPQLQNPSATSTSGTMNAPTGFTNLIFADQFNGTSLNTSKWVPQIGRAGNIWNDNGKLPLPYSAVGNQGLANAEYGNPSEVIVNNGLTLAAQRDTSMAGYTWKAGYITTFGKFTFNKGYVQVKAKMPDSTSGGWAGIWFLDANGVNENEIDLQESGYPNCGSTAVNQCVAMNLHTNGNSQKIYNAGVDLSADYHIYGMKYVPGSSITMYFDGKQVAQYTTNIPTGAYEIILTNTIAQNVPWHTVVGNSTPQQLNYQISEVQVWQ